jgi:hypothetical protein
MRRAANFSSFRVVFLCPAVPGHSSCRFRKLRSEMRVAADNSALLLVFLQPVGEHCNTCLLHLSSSSDVAPLFRLVLLQANRTLKKTQFVIKCGYPSRATDV